MPRLLRARRTGEIRDVARHPSAPGPGRTPRPPPARLVRRSQQNRPRTLRIRMAAARQDASPAPRIQGGILAAPAQSRDTGTPDAFRPTRCRAESRGRPAAARTRTWCGKGDRMEAAGGSAAARVAGHDVEWTPPPLSRRDRFMSMAATLIALSLAGLDQTIVATAGPAIQRDLAIPAALYAWITTAYLVASTVMLPIYGKLSDVLGRKPVLIGGVSLFLLGSLLAGLAPNTLALIAARVVQGLGAASLFTTTLAVIADLYPPQVRGRYMGLIGAVMGITSVIGPLVGGIITDLFGWHWVFFVNLPLGALALAFII